MKAKRLFIDIKLLVAIFCCVALLCASPIYAQADNVGVGKAKIGETVYPNLVEAVKAAESGDTIQLGDGHYSLYGNQNTDLKTNDETKELTFVGQGAGSTFWAIGAEAPDPSKFGTEFNGDYSFDGIGKITFKNMTLQSSTADYLGFIRADHTVVEDCVINGKTFYWGYKTALFKNTTFNAPKGGFFGGDYAIWTYCSPVMTFDGCTFNSFGKTINVYSDFTAAKTDITINYSNCTVNSSKAIKTILNINDNNKFNKKFYINISGKNIINGKVYRDTRKPKDTNHTSTCSRLFGFGGKQDTNNTGRTVVTIDGIKVFENGARVSHEIDTPNDKYTDGYKDNAYTFTDWIPTADGTQYTYKKICNYCKDEQPMKGYKLKYDPNGGKWADGTTTVQEETASIDVALTIKGSPTMNGYNFVKWEGNPDSYKPGEKYNTKNNKELINGTLKAVWEKAPAGGSAARTYPQTGDASNVTAWTIAMLACAAVIGLLLKKRNYNASK